LDISVAISSTFNQFDLVVEFISGALFALGLFTPIAALLIAGTMVVAIVKVHGPNGYWITQNGFE